MKKLILLLGCLFLILGFEKSVYAGEINDAEESVIKVAEGTFEMNGNKYVAKACYIKKMREKFLEDGCQLTTKQASDLIDTINQNVANGIQQGILEPVEPKKMQLELKCLPSLIQAQKKKSVSTEEKPDSLVLLLLICICAASVFTLTLIKNISSIRKRKKALELADTTLSELMREMDGFSDIHTHILPGVDDGAKDLDEALKMLDIAYDNGIRSICLTSHFQADYEDFDTDQLQNVYDNLKMKVQQKYGEKITMYLGNEVFYSDGVIKRLQEKKALTIADSRYVLIEFNLSVTYKEIYQACNALIQNSYVPIIAHFERYPCLFEQEERIRELKSQGVALQLNASSIYKKSRRMQKFCLKMIKKHLVHFVSTDAHDTVNRPPIMMEPVRVLLSYGVSKHRVKKILYSNFKRIKENQIL